MPIKTYRLRTGSSLIEVMLFLGIFSIMSGSIVGVYISTQEARIRQQAIAELEQNGTVLLQTMSKNIRRAEKVLAPLANQTGSILALQMAENNEFPTLFARNGSGNLLSVQNTVISGLLPPRVTVSRLIFRNVADTNVTFTFTLTITMPTIVPKLYSRNFTATVTLFPDDESEAGGCGSCPGPVCTNDNYTWYRCNNGSCELSATTFPGCSQPEICSITEVPELSCDDVVDNDCDALIDCADTSCAGRSCGIGMTCQSGTCTGGDTTPPTITTLSPPDNATGVTVGANVVITFSELVNPQAAGNMNILIKNANDNTTVATIPAQNAQVTGGGTTTITVNPTSDLTPSTPYYVQIGADAFDDAAGNSFAGISDTTTWNFTTGAGVCSEPSGSDTTPPVISNVAASCNDTTATITWTTDECADAQVEYGTSNRAFTPSEEVIPTGSNPFTVAIGDLDNDGDADLAVANYGGSSVSVMRNNGNGTFAAKVDYATGLNPTSVAIGDLDGDGDRDLAVTNGSGPIYAVSVLLNNGNGTFAAKMDYSATGGPKSIAIGDFDGDGDRDLVIAGGQSSVSVLLNNGSGIFAARTDYVVGFAPNSVAIGDLDNDGDRDLAVSSELPDTVSILLNNGNGTFATKVDYATGLDPRTLVIGDLDGDGDGDLAIANQSSSSISLLLNNGNGTFAAKVDYATSNTTTSIAIGDLDNDGDLDLAAPHGPLSVFMNNGDGTFEPKVNTGGGGIAWSVAIGDLNGDGKADLAGPDQGRNTVNVVFNNGVAYGNTTTLNTTMSTSHSEQVTGLSPGTLYHFRAKSKDASSNLSFSPDVVCTTSAADTTPPTIATLYPLDNATNVATNTNLVISFSEPVLPQSAVDVSILIYRASNGSLVAVIPASDAQVTGGGTAIITVNPSVDLSPDTAYYVQIGADAFDDAAGNSFAGISDTTTWNFTTGGGACSAPSAGDTTPPAISFPAVSCDATTGTMTWSTNECSTTQVYYKSHLKFATKADYGTDSGYPRSVAVGDFNGDGKADLASANISTSTISVFMNTGNGTFSPRVDYAAGSQVMAVAADDLNGDGKTDLLSVNAADDTVAVFMNQGNGTFAPRVNYATGQNPNTIAVGDIDRDGDADVAIANFTGNSISVLRNNGNGTFAPKVDHAVELEPTAIAMSDLGGDGNMDLVFTNRRLTAPATYEYFVSVFMGNGNGTFAPKVDYETGQSTSLTIGDLNADGKGDVVVANAGPSASRVSVLMNGGNGTLNAAIHHTTEGSDLASSLSIGDLDGDGKDDLLAVFRDQTFFGVFLQQPSGTFAAMEQYQSGGPTFIHSRSVALGDFNGDRKIDVAIANNLNFVSVFLNATTNMALSPLDTTLTTSHSLTVTNLPPGTLYHFLGESKDASGNAGVSGEYSCTTTVVGSCNEGEACTRNGGLVSGCDCGSFYYCVDPATNVIIGDGAAGECRAFSDSIAAPDEDHVSGQCFEPGACSWSGPCSVNSTAPGQAPGICEAF